MLHVVCATEVQGYTRTGFELCFATEMQWCACIGVFGLCIVRWFREHGFVSAKYVVLEDWECWRMWMCSWCLILKLFEGVNSSNASVFKTIRESHLGRDVISSQRNII